MEKFREKTREKEKKKKKNRFAKKVTWLGDLKVSDCRKYIRARATEKSVRLFLAVFMKVSRVVIARDNVGKSMDEVGGNFLAIGIPGISSTISASVPSPWSMFLSSSQTTSPITDLLEFFSPITPTTTMIPCFSPPITRGPPKKRHKMIDYSLQEQLPPQHFPSSQLLTTASQSQSSSLPPLSSSSSSSSSSSATAAGVWSPSPASLVVPQTKTGEQQQRQQQPHHHHQEHQHHQHQQQHHQPQKFVAFDFGRCSQGDAAAAAAAENEATSSGLGGGGGTAMTPRKTARGKDHLTEWLRWLIALP